MNIQNMTDEEKRVKIAEACGFVRHRAIRNPFHAYLRRLEWTMDGWELCDGSEKQVNADLCPDYLNSLDAMHEAEKTLTEEQCDAFNSVLMDLKPSRALILHPSERWSWGSTARQRADAFLLTLA